jgi:hypothetical protein
VSGRSKSGLIREFLAQCFFQLGAFQVAEAALKADWNVLGAPMNAL